MDVQGRIQGGGGVPVSRNPSPPRAVEIYRSYMYIDYDGRGSPNWLGPLAY